MPDEGFAKAFAQNATVEQIALCRAVQRPISVRCIQEPVASPAWKTKPVWYLLAEEDRMINPQAQRFMAERMKATIRRLPSITHRFLPRRTKSWTLSVRRPRQHWAEMLSRLPIGDLLNRHL